MSDCLKCGHGFGTDLRGRCIAALRDAGGSMVYCGCECVFSSAPAEPVQPDGEQENADKFHCENCEQDFTESPHATADGYWLCDPCWRGLRDEECDKGRSQMVPRPTTETKYVYCFHLWPDETWGHTRAGDEHAKIPAAVFDLFRMINHGIEMVFTPLEFVRFRHDVESFGITLREITRVPYHEEETVS